MSPRRALATAIVMAIFPSLVFVGGISRHSENICEQLIGKLDFAFETKKDLRSQCTKSIKEEQLQAFYWVLLASVFINWPVIRWLDDRQWYREWIKKEAVE